MIEEPPEEYELFHEELSKRKTEKSFIEVSPFDNLRKDEKLSRSKVMTEVLLDKISELETKVKFLEEEKKILK